MSAYMITIPYVGSVTRRRHNAYQSSSGAALPTSMVLVRSPVLPDWAAMRLGALFQVAFDGGLLKLPAASDECSLIAVFPLAGGGCPPWVLCGRARVGT